MFSIPTSATPSSGFDPILRAKPPLREASTASAEPAKEAVSVPGPPFRVSRPLAPTSLSLPAPPRMTSLPPRPSIVSLFGPPQITSSPAVPVIPPLPVMSQVGEETAQSASESQTVLVVRRVIVEPPAGIE